MSESLQEAINQVAGARSKQEIISSALKEMRVSKNALGMMGTRPETESPSGEMARAYKSQGKRGTPEERYEKAKKKVERTSTQRTTGRSPKVNRETDKMNASIAASLEQGKKRYGYTRDSTDFTDRVMQGASDLLEAGGPPNRSTLKLQPIRRFTTGISKDLRGEPQQHPGPGPESVGSSNDQRGKMDVSRGRSNISSRTTLPKR